ncbi:MAG: DUF2336 domain-containing protein [Pseudorhodoplanes sp.]
MRSDAFPNLDGLVGLARNGDVDIRPTLLRVLTDLYIQKPVHSDEEERHYTELALRLIEAVDVPVRAAVSERLARHAAPPLPVVRRLARDVLDVAQPLLSHSPVLSQDDLLHIARELGPHYAAVIATRREFTPRSQEAPVARESAPAPAELETNLTELFFSADAQERRLILLNLDLAPIPPARTLLSTAAQDANSRFEQAALRRDAAAAAQELERALGVSRAHARRMIADPSGEPILVAAKALGMPAAMLQRILLFVNPAIGRSVSRVYELSALYEEIALESAQRLLAIWQADHPRTTKPGHQPQLWHDPKKDMASHEAVRIAHGQAPTARRQTGS